MCKKIIFRVEVDIKVSLVAVIPSLLFIVFLSVKNLDTTLNHHKSLTYECMSTITDRWKFNRINFPKMIYGCAM